MLQTHCTHNEMLSHYYCILIGCFKDIFQTVDTNNLSAVLQAIKELNFILANREPELSAYYGFPLEPWQVSTEEVPDIISANLHRPTAISTEHSSRGRPHSHRARSSYQSRYSDRDRHHSYSSPKNQYLQNQASNSYQNSSNTPHIANNRYPLNISELIGSLQSQIIGLQSQPLQQLTLNSIKMFNGTNKAEFATWAQSIKNAARLCNLDALSITLSKLQGAPLKSANYLESKETNSGRKLFGTTLKQHLTSNCSEIPHSTHAINAYDSLQQGIDESTEAYLHRAQDIFRMHTSY